MMMCCGLSCEKKIELWWEKKKWVGVESKQNIKEVDNLNGR